MGTTNLSLMASPIHGCIDGFSRRLVWLKVSRTNNDPAVVAGFFLEAVQHEGGCSAILRTDNGTENTFMASVQSYLRADGQDEHADIYLIGMLVYLDCLKNDRTSDSSNYLERCSIIKIPFSFVSIFFKQSQNLFL